MKILVDALIILGVVAALLGFIGKLTGIFLIAPLLRTPITHLELATFLLVLALIIDFKSK